MCNVTELTTVIQDCYNTRRPLYISGKPGIAKTHLVEQVMASMGHHTAVFNSAALDPSSFGIVTVRADNSACDITPTAEFVDQPAGTCMFFDEFDKLDTLIQNCMIPLIQFNRLHGRKLNDRWYCAAGNPMGSGKGQYEVSKILLARMIRVEFSGPTWDEWSDHAVKKGIDYMLLAFLSDNKGLLNAYDEKADASPTYRQWLEQVNPIMNSSVRHIMTPGAVGLTASSKLEVFLKLTSKLPKYQDLLLMPNYKIPDDFVLQAILSTMLGMLMDGKDAQTLKPVIDQMPMEFIMSAFKRAMMRKAKDFDKFIVQNNYMQLMHDAMK